VLHLGGKRVDVTTLHVACVVVGGRHRFAAWQAGMPALQSLALSNHRRLTPLREVAGRDACAPVALQSFPLNHLNLITNANCSACRLGNEVLAE
jgi:hypothetical protein